VSQIDPASLPSIHIVIPGLFGPIAPNDAANPTERPDIPAMETLLARSESLRNTVPLSYEACLFSLFDVEIPDSGDIPVAAITRVLDMGVIDKGWWLRADPVHLHPERDRLILSDARVLDITQDEASSLVAEIMEVYGPDGWRLKAPRPERWYLKPRRTPRITTTPLAEVVGRDIHPYLPQGKDGMAWHGVLNEIQILLHTANANAEREQKGKLPINSLWFWGGGKLPSIKPVRWTRVWSQDAVSLALARLSEVTTSGVPDSFSDWQRAVKAGGDHLVVFDQVRAAVQYGDWSFWAKFIQELDRNWMAPLFTALKEDRIASVSLYTDTGLGFLITARQARRWWRRRRRHEDYR